RAILPAKPPAMPKQVYLCCVLLSSYCFLRTPPLASDALASRIVFPSVGVTPSSFRWPGLPASPGKQKRAPNRSPEDWRSNNDGMASGLLCLLPKQVLLDFAGTGLGERPAHGYARNIKAGHVVPGVLNQC